MSDMDPLYNLLRMTDSVIHHQQPEDDVTVLMCRKQTFLILDDIILKKVSLHQRKLRLEKLIFFGSFITNIII